MADKPKQKTTEERMKDREKEGAKNKEENLTPPKEKEEKMPEPKKASGSFDILDGRMKYEKFTAKAEYVSLEQALASKDEKIVQAAKNANEIDHYTNAYAPFYYGECNKMNFLLPCQVLDIPKKEDKKEEKADKKPAKKDKE